MAAVYHDTLFFTFQLHHSIFRRATEGIWLVRKEPMFFDFDGVLGNTYALNWMLVKMLHPEVSEEGYRIAHHMGNVFETPTVPFTEETATAYYLHYNQQLSVEHVRHACPTLRELSRDFNFHIVTSNCEHAIRRVLGDAGVLHLFTHILGQEAHASKVAKFKCIAALEGIDLQDAHFITDTLGDLLEAAKVGLPAYGVTWGYHPEEILRQGNPRALFRSWTDLRRAFA